MKKQIGYTRIGDKLPTTRNTCQHCNGEEAYKSIVRSVVIDPNDVCEVDVVRVAEIVLEKDVEWENMSAEDKRPYFLKGWFT